MDILLISIITTPYKTPSMDSSSHESVSFDSNNSILSDFSGNHIVLRKEYTILHLTRWFESTSIFSRNYASHPTCSKWVVSYFEVLVYTASLALFLGTFRPSTLGLIAVSFLRNVQGLLNKECFGVTTSWGTRGDIFFWLLLSEHLALNINFRILIE